MKRLHALIVGYGDNERAQLGHDTLRGCLETTVIFVQEMVDGVDLIPKHSEIQHVLCFKELYDFYVQTEQH